MNPKFISIFIEQAGSFDSYARLRRLVVDMAIRGDLDEKCNQESAVEKVASEIKSAIDLARKQGKANKVTEKLGPVQEKERLPQYATHRHFVRIGDIASVSKGLTGIKDSKPGPYPLVVTAEGRSSCDHFDYEGPSVVIPMVSSTGHGDASLNRIHYQEGRYAVGSILCVLQPVRPDLISTRFLFEYLSAFKDELLVSRMIGTANVSLTTSKVAEIPVPLVSFAAQKHVYELMKLCDTLEQNGRLADEQHARLTSTLFNALAASESAHDLAENWNRVAENFDLLLDRPEAVDTLEQTILQLAVRGLLVPQDPNDEPASELLKKIRAEKDRLILERRLKSDKPLPPIEENEFPFLLPTGWEWVRFGNATINRDGERIPVSSDDRVMRAKIYDYYGASGVIDKIDNFLFDTTLLLIGEDGANLINRSTPIAFLAHGKYWVNNHAHVIDTTHPELMTYMELFINAISLEPYVTGTAQPKMNQAKLNSIVVPLPPLAEQSRIVACVESLRHLCTQLRRRLVTTRERQSQLAEALVEKQSTATV